MRSIVIIIAVSICSICSLAAEDPIADMTKLPEPLQEEVNQTLVLQMKELADAQEAIQRHRDRLIQSLERSKRRYERGRNADPAAVVAIDAMIESQKAAPSTVPVASEAVMKSLPFDPSQPQDIFDGRTIEQRKADFAAQREWERVVLTSSRDKAVFLIPRGQFLLMHNDESQFFSQEKGYLAFELSILKDKGPFINVDNIFASTFPKSYENGVRPVKLEIYSFTMNGIVPIMNGKPAPNPLTIISGVTTNLVDFMKK